MVAAVLSSDRAFLSFHHSGPKQARCLRGVQSVCSVQESSGPLLPTAGVRKQTIMNTGLFGLLLLISLGLWSDVAVQKTHFIVYRYCL
jgi:hypothetical protein